MITKKHFKKIAEILNGLNSIDECDNGCFGVVKPIIEELCDYFETLNPNFDKDKFIDVVLS